MKEIDEENLDTALALGEAICNELGICCEKRGTVIFRVYKKLEELRLQKLMVNKLHEGSRQPEQQSPPGDT